ncbi:RNA helicase, partial [Verrucomicrobiota bacterium]
ENGIVEDYRDKYVRTEVGKLLIANSISEIDAFSCESEIQGILGHLKKNSINNSNQLMQVIAAAFIPHIKDTRENAVLRRMENEAAQRFYSMLIDWKISNASFPMMIAKMLSHWKKVIENPYHDGDVFVGKWGDKAREGGHRKYYVHIPSKVVAERVNLAIVRIKEEEDLLEYRLFRFIDVLEALGFLDSTFFKLIKYGTADDQKIGLMKYGFSSTLSERILKKYSHRIAMSGNEVVRVNSLLISDMKAARESRILVLEAELNTKKR